MKKNKIFDIVILLVIALTITFGVENSVYAEDTSTDYKFWDEASEWYKNGESKVSLGAGPMGQLATLVEVAGTGVIAIATVVLGMKYMLGSVNDKANCKENLITLLVACVFFFGWSGIRTILISGATFTDEGVVENFNGGIQAFFFKGAATMEQALATVFTIVSFAATAVAFGVTLYMGVKLIFGGAEEKAKIKQRGVMYIIGIILILLTSQILKFISNAVNEVVK